MGWGRKSHFYCEVESSRAHTEKICADAGDGLTITAAGWKGAIKLRVGHCSTGDYFVVSFIPWLKSENPRADMITIARGTLDYDKHVDGEITVRLNEDLIEAFKLLRAKEIMTEGIPSTSD